MFSKLSSLILVSFGFSSLAQAQLIEDLIPGQYVFSKAESEGVGVSVCGKTLTVTKAQRTASVLFLGPSFQFLPRNIPRSAEASSTIKGCDETDENSREQQDGITILTRELHFDCPSNRKNDHKTFWRATIHRTGKIEIDMALRDGPDTEEEATGKCVWIKK